ncbi:helix-turn-helix domain-containing protein, partial [Lactococcus petauri]
KDYIKHGSTWFNGKGWEDDYDTTPRQEIFAGNKVVKSAPSWATPYTEPEYTDEEIADVFKE